MGAYSLALLKEKRTSPEAEGLTESYIACYNGILHIEMVPTLAAVADVADGAVVTRIIGRCDCQKPSTSGQLYLDSHDQRKLERLSKIRQYRKPRSRR